MALISCPECGKEISDKATACPHCGKKQKENAPLSLFNNIWIYINRFYTKHRIISIVGFVWFLFHITLLISSDSINNQGNKFYPFSRKLAQILDGEFFTIDFLKYIDYYDFTEFFGYIVLLPLFILGVCKLFLLLRSKYKEKKLNNNGCVDKEYNATYSDKQQSIPSEHDNINIVSSNNDISSISTVNNKSDVEKQKNGFKTDNVLPYPLFLIRRLGASLIDKIVIISVSIAIIFIIGSSSADYMGNLGRYSAFFHMSTTEVYNSAIGTVMQNFPSDRISQHQSEIDECYSNFIFIDIIYTLQFVIVNIIYYYFSERKWNASPGKHVLGLVLVSTSKNQLYYKIDNSKIKFRSIIFVLLMIIMLIIRWIIGINYYGIMFLFFLLLDIPVLFTGNSLIDILSRTKLIAFVNQKTLTDNTI